MSGEAVIYNGGAIYQRACPNHTHRRPIHPSTLTARLWVRDEIERRHADHYMPEPGCAPCFRGPSATSPGWTE